MAEALYGDLPFLEQIQYLLGKELVPTDAWYDLWQGAHDTGFMVAGAAKGDLLHDLHQAVLRGVTGGTLADFRAQFDAIVERHGWTGWTGEDTPGGRAWRTRVIYETNLYQSHTAGRWEQIAAVRADRPYVLRVHADSVANPRPLHLQWDGLILRSDDPWVAEHPGAEGWGCKCRWLTLSEDDLRARGKTGPDQAPKRDYYVWTHPRTGEERRIPVGVDPGFGHRPGARRDLAAELRAKAAGYPGSLREALLADIEGRKPVAPAAPEPRGA